MRASVSDVPVAWVLGAPTASGKSAVALDLAERLGLEIVVADAMQVYRGLDVGTAKPTREEQARVRHHMIDVVAVDAGFSVADWVRGAELAILDAAGRGVGCLVVGGTGFYLDALAHGLPLTPPADPVVQARLWARLEEEGLDVLLGALAAVAPEDAVRTERNPRRVVRALEIVERTGRAPSSFGRSRPQVRVDRTWLVPGMEVLAPRIEARARAMLVGGWPEEAARLDEEALATASQAIGYGEAAALARGELSFEEALERIVVGTRQYAKRQRTWFKRHAAERVFENVAEFVRDDLERWLASQVD